MPRFHDNRHQDAAVALLRRALASSRTSHAYLFDGPEGVGKERCARALAARLLCEGALAAHELEPCCACRSCLLIERDAHPDFHFVHRGLHKQHPERTVRASKGLFLAVDVVRHFLITPASSTPTLGVRRVFLVRDAERMNEEAQNALLKTLEEPPGAAVLILITASAGRLLPTIRSRCQRIPFCLLPAAFIEEQLVGAGASRAEAAALAGLAQGRLGLALRWREMGLFELFQPTAAALELSRDPETFAKSLLEVAEQVATRTKAGRPDSEEADEAAEGLGELSTGAGDEDGRKPRGAGKFSTDEQRDALRLTLAVLATRLRDGLLAAVGGGGSRSERPERAGQLADHISAIAVAEAMLDRNVAPQLALERLAIVIGEPAALPVTRAGANAG